MVFVKCETAISRDVTNCFEFTKDKFLRIVSKTDKKNIWKIDRHER